MTVYLADNERKKRIDRVIDYILGNPNSEISLQTLAAVANYSPFHLQKIFKQIVGESPKQYIKKLRLEKAFHLMLIHPQKSIQEIGMDCGFSSPAVFSRAIKSCFGYSPAQLRDLSHKQKMKILHGSKPKSTPAQASKSNNAPGTSQINIHTVRRESVQGIYLIVPFDDPIAIQCAFKELSGIAVARDWITTEPIMYGLLSPHLRNSYRAFIPLNKGSAGLNNFNCTEIKGGKFATFRVKGDLKQTYKAAHFFYHEWLPESGYKVAGVTGFETFSENPTLTPYFQLEREIYIPIEPVV